MNRDGFIITFSDLYVIYVYYITRASLVSQKISYYSPWRRMIRCGWIKKPRCLRNWGQQLPLVFFFVVFFSYFSESSTLEMKNLSSFTYTLMSFQTWLPFFCWPDIRCTVVLKHISFWILQKKKSMVSKWWQNGPFGWTISLIQE